MKGRTAPESLLGRNLRGSTLRVRRRESSSFELEASQLRAALGGSAQPLMIIDEFDHIWFANAAAARLFATPLEQLQHSDLHRHLAVGQTSTGVGNTVLGQGAQAHAPRTRELMAADGRLLRATLSLLCDRFGESTHVCLCFDAEERPSAGSAVEVLGRLTAELVHDINNQLSAALNYVFILQRRAGGEEPWASHLDGLQAAAWRAAALAGGLRLVGRKRSSAPQMLRLDSTIATLEPVLQHMADTITLELRLEPGVPEVNAPLAYLEQVVIMVTLFALGRAPLGSTLRIETESVVDAAGHTIPRLICELITDVAAAAARPRGAMHQANGILRRALKRCHGRIGHDVRRVWVDFGREEHASVVAGGDGEARDSIFVRKRERRSVRSS